MISELIECKVCGTLKEVDKTCGFCAVEHIIDDLKKPAVDRKHIKVPNYDYVLDDEYTDPLYEAYLNNIDILEQIEEES
jgi:hypothetical protein